MNEVADNFVGKLHNLMSPLLYLKTAHVSIRVLHHRRKAQLVIDFTIFYLQKIIYIRHQTRLLVL